jgi:type IV secretion system protein VirB11
MTEVLDAVLAPVRQFLTADDVENIEICRPGRVVVTRRGLAKEVLDRPDITAAWLATVGDLLAKTTDQTLSADRPTLAAWLPSGDRVQVVRPPAVREGCYSLVIRRHHYRAFSLEQLQEAGAFEHTRIGRRPRARASALSEHAQQMGSAGDVPAFLSAAIEERRNVVVSGPQNTGKTTVLNALLMKVEPTDTVVTIEDVPELQLPHIETWHGLLSSYGQQGVSQLSVHDQLSRALRLSADRILVGELRGREAWTFLQAMNTGEVGCATSLHALSATDALSRAASMALEGAPDGTDIRYLTEQFDGFVDVWISTSMRMTPAGRHRFVAEVQYA